MSGSLFAALLAFSVQAFAGESGPFALSTGKESARSLRDFDIDAVVKAVTSGMADASRNYYLPDKPENAKDIKQYRKDAKFLMDHDSDFRRALGGLAIVLAKTAVDAVNGDQPQLPGKPLALSPKQRYEPFDEGVSSITVTEGDIKVVEINTMPCINAAAKGLFRGVRDQYMPGAPENSPESQYYHHEASASMSSDRFYNHTLSELCAKLVEAAKMRAEEKGGKSRR